MGQGSSLYVSSIPHVAIAKQQSDPPISRITTPEIDLGAMAKKWWMGGDKVNGAPQLICLSMINSNG